MDVKLLLCCGTQRIVANHSEMTITGIGVLCYNLNQEITARVATVDCLQWFFSAQTKQIS